jgi:phage host-nuclease inhibitor protein Gam
MILRSTRHTINSPQNPDEASDFVRRIQELDHQMEEIELGLSKQVTALTSEAEEKLIPLQHLRDELMRGLEIYATAHRDTILPPVTGRKSLRVSCGRYGWRTGNWCVTIDDEDALVAELESRRLSAYISKKKIVNRSMLLKDREKIEHLKLPGVSFQRGERFFVETDKTTAKREEVTV